jgi:hypothetical protein
MVASMANNNKENNAGGVEEMALKEPEMNNPRCKPGG